jgi:hypothetical protein
MIVFDLACGGGHVFEAWFGSQADYEGQKARGLVSCPSCGDVGVGKAPMAPRIATGRAVERPAAHAESGDPQGMARALMAAQTELLSRSEDVGRRFAEEARAIHSGDSENRLIHGQASRDEAKALVRDGVPVAPLPFPVRDKTRDN